MEESRGIESEETELCKLQQDRIKVAFAMQDALKAQTKINCIL